MPGVSFDQPQYLIGLCLLPLFWWVAARRSLVAQAAAGQKTVALLLRGALVTLIVLALSDPHLVRSSRANGILFVIDASRSLSRTDRQKALEYVNQAARNMAEQDRIGVIAVGTEARLAFPLSGRGKVAADLSVPDPSRTNLARGVTTALSNFPENLAPRIVLISDGNENAGAVLEAARSAVADDTPIDVIAIGAKPEREALLEGLLTPTTARRGEPFPVKALARSERGGTGTIRLYRDGAPVGEQTVTLRPGRNVVTLPQQTAPTPGFYRYEARLFVGSGEDTLPENNRALSFVKVQGQPRLLLVANDSLSDSAALPRALRSRNLTVDVVSPKRLPTQAAALLTYDGIILSNVPSEDLSAKQMSALQTGVRDLGIGLTMIGGDRSFGAGGYYETPIEETLPVEMDVRKLRRYPGVALALAIDYSGSMNARGQNATSGMSKLDLAREAAHRAVDTLSAQDQVGVIAVDSRATVVVPLQYAKDKKAIHAGLGAVYGGGGTEMSAAVKSGYALLEKAEAKIKHILLVTDGETRPFAYGEIIRRMRAKKITFSLVVIDEGQSPEGIEPLKRVTRATGGRFYFVRDAAQIPRIYTREVQTASRPPILEEPFAPRVAAENSPLLSGITWDDAPPLLGYDVVTPKLTAEVALVSHKGDPILATWQYGLGKATAFTSDAQAHWGAPWLGWEGYGPFWAQTLRWSLRNQEGGSYQSSIELVNGQGRIRLDAVDDGTSGFVNFLDARARVIAPDGGVQTVRLAQTGPGRYEGAFDARKTGAYVATVTQRDRSGAMQAISSIGLAVPYSPEFAAREPNTALLARVADLTGGSVLTGGPTIFQSRRRIRRVPVPLALPLLLAALLLFPLDVAARRLRLSSARQAGELAGALRERIALSVEERRERTRQRARASNAAVGRLVDRKARLEAEEAETYETPPSSSRSEVAWGRAAPPATPAEVRAPDPAGDYRSRLRDAKRRAAREEEAE